ncbi:plasmid SOS inhibition protein A [Aeromonas hydrophila]|uniref:Plasmid SOS inhibition protein A n=1 Tax=Aeromonas hydrophila TaxID=644 RepID=A0A926IYG8_AERHY|nr:plasmid SOS inhibition protein A [Aeromonas hydrophila]
MFPYPLPLDLQDRLFPYQAHRKGQRTLHHIDIHLNRDRKVAMKRRSVQHAAYDTEVERAWQALSASTRQGLGAWYSEWSEHEVNGNSFSDYTFRSLLARWHRVHADGPWSWDDLYHSIPTWKVVLDMQLDITD